MSITADTFQGLNNLLESDRYSINRCCQAVDNCLEANRDNLRGFFEQCFSLLLKQIFGYQGSSWLNTIAKGGQEQDAKALVGLLSPNGHLFQAIHNADADNLIKFEFPLNRLPTHTQQLIRLEPGRKELEKWPQYQKHILVDGRGNCHVHLNVFEYFVFWTAFYVLRSSQVTSEYHPLASPRGYGHLAPSLGTVRKAFTSLHRDRSSAMRHPYLRLLRQYLEHFLPRGQSARSATPHRGFQSPSRPRGADAARAARGRVLFSVLLEFWLTDADEPVPLPLASQGSQELLNAWKDANSVRVRSFEPPSEDLIEALTVLTRYVTAVDEGRDSRPKPAQTSPWLPNAPSETGLQARAMALAHAPGRLGHQAAAPAQAFARRLFRFLRRALQLWPEQQPLTPVVHLWLAYITPWCTPRLSQELLCPPQQTRRRASRPQPPGWGEAGMEVPVWESHVLANVPFYTVLVPLFLDLLRRRVSSRGDAALTDLVKAMRVLKASPQLLQLLRSVEADLARFTSQPGRRPEGIFADVLPFLVDQLQDWEAYAGAGQAAPLAQATGDTLMFGTDEASAAAKARHLLNAAAGAARMELVNEARSLVHEVLPVDQLPPSHLAASPQRSQPQTPIRGLRRSSFAELKYKGEWMRRPLSSSEVGWLVRILLHISDAANIYFQLDQPPPAADGPLPRSLKGLGMWLRRRGWKIDLRPLGEKQTLAWLPVCILALWLLNKMLFLLVGVLFVTAGEV